MSWIATNSPKSRPELFQSQAEQLSFYINSYNALAAYGVIQNDIPKGFTTLLARTDFFYLTNFIIGGEKISLYDYENQVIRPLGEEKIHFALNCMVRACPRLPKQVFRASNLEKQLEDTAKEFFSNEKHIKINNEEKTVRVSEILKFYTEDFISDNTPNLIAYINLWREQPIPSDYKLKFIPYDWKINSTDDQA